MGVADDPLRAVRIYESAKARITEMVADLDEAGVSAAVAACPGWSVRDVVAHLAATADDWGHRRLTGPPTDDQTAAQIARFDGQDMAGIIAAWSEAAAQLHLLAETTGVEPPVGDIASHEHDVRAALGRPGARDSAAVRFSADRLLSILRTPVALRVTVDGADYRSGPDDGAEIRLSTTWFDALRWRTGRRSRAQLAAMDWSDDPEQLLDHLYLFGPAEDDLVE
ncbi:maleylpyruvate isomerase family mycothiol-dependent enzyme [Mycolicibacterium moriokaense]|nr:maleylpyruvate isomerase family mycothiol-dependent enzyme [Mycolicibacterium moriokaense]